jgi:hypothetical protein
MWSKTDYKVESGGLISPHSNYLFKTIFSTNHGGVDKKIQVQIKSTEYCASYFQLGHLLL